MPEVESVSIGSTGVDVSPSLDSIGIEFEYPIRGDRHYPTLNAENSDSFYRQCRPLNLPDGYEDVPTGRMMSEHTGAEVTSSVMDLHTNEPELWYEAVIELGAQTGHPFGANGWGSTNFGLHLHVSSLPREKAELLYGLCQEDWFRIFVCASLNRQSADPWRHGGVSANDLNGNHSFERQYTVNSRRGEGHYEWRMPEPVVPEHLEMILHFLRLLEVDGYNAAEEYARDRVFNADNRLTVVQQYEILREEVSGWPTRRARQGGNRTDAEAAETLIDIME